MYIYIYVLYVCIYIYTYIFFYLYIMFIVHNYQMLLRGGGLPGGRIARGLLRGVAEGVDLLIVIVAILLIVIVAILLIVIVAILLIVIVAILLIVIVAIGGRRARPAARLGPATLSWRARPCAQPGPRAPYIYYI